MGAPPKVDDSAVIPAGEVLAGRYRIEGVLGSGGMGRVYRAEHTAIGKPVAIKVLHAGLGRNQEAATRFQREAIASGRLDHPNIVSVRDSGVLDSGSPFLVMELLEGEHLGTRLNRVRPMRWQEALPIIRGVLLGLRHAHERGVIHRDIKPDNIFLAKKGGEEIVKILDFGIAKLYAGGSDNLQATRAGMTVGTPTYLSPEQAVGGAITPACDLYSTSIVLYELLIGRAPFEAENAMTLLTAHATQEVPRFRELAPRLVVPRGLEDLVRNGLAKISAQRIGTAVAYVQRIDHILTENGVKFEPLVISEAASSSMGIPAGPHAGVTPVSSSLAPSPDFLGASLVFPEPKPTTPTPVATANLRPVKPPPPPPPLPQRSANSKIPRAAWLAGGAIALLGVGVGVYFLASSGGDEPADAHGAPPAAVEPRVPSPPPRPPVDEREVQLKAALQKLQQGPTCAARKAAIPKLVELGNRTAIPALQSAKNRGAANACLRLAADDAIKKLGNR